MSDLKNFEKKLPPLFEGLLNVLGKSGYTVTVVGGVVRDFFLTGEIGEDWDVEISHPTLAWDSKSWKDLGKELTKLGRVSYLPYDVIRVEEKKLTLELSPPRKENFTDENHHKNFTVAFDYRMPFSEAILRRDFTINAMGIRFRADKKLEFLDPLEGILHLRNKELHACGEDFGRDPVRFIRAFRFAVKFGFSISPSLRKILDLMKVEGISSSYLWSEMQKSKAPLNFYKKLLDEKDFHPELRLPTSDIRSIIPALEKTLFDPSRHEAWIIALEWEGIDSLDWQKFFNISSESGKRLSRWARVTREFSSLMPENFHGEFEDVRERPDFEKLFDWYFTTRQILQKNPELPLLKMIEGSLPEWVHLYKFEPPKDVKHIDPPYRAKYQVWSLCQRL